jgi:hypothetical protein
MKKISSLLIGSFFCVLTTLAQAPGILIPVGFINAVGLVSRTDLKIDGQSLKPKGFAEGGYVSSVGLVGGNHQFSFTNGDCEPLIQAITVREGSSPLYIVYKVSVPQPNRTIKNVLKLAEVPTQAPARGPRFFIFSTFERRSASLQINGAPLSFEPFKLVSVEGSSLTVASEGVKPVRFNPDESGNYVLVIFDGSNSRLRSSFVPMAK